MKMRKAIAALVALTFGAVAFAATAGVHTVTESFDGLTVGALDTTIPNSNVGEAKWVPWTAEEDDYALTVTAWGDTTTPTLTPDAITDTQKNYLHIETTFTNGLTFAANGIEQDTSVSSPITYKPSPYTIDGDQIYFDSLVNLTVGDPEQMSAVDMPGDGRLALWVQEEEQEGGETIGRLCIRAGSTTGYSTAVYTTKTAVATGWHRLTVRLFKNAARSGSQVAAMAVYLDQDAVQASVAPMSEDVIKRLTPKAKKLADKDALFQSVHTAPGTDLGDVKGVQFAGNGDIDNIVFTTARPSFITADDDTNYFQLTWDKNVTGISYTIGESSAQSITDLTTYSADIPLNESGDTVIAVTATYATDFGAGTWTAVDASLEGTTFTVTAGTLTPSGAIVSASTAAAATATVKIGDGNEIELSATTLSDLINLITEALDGQQEASGTVYIKLSADQTVTLVEGEEGNVKGTLYLGTAESEITWTLDLNGFTITGDGDVGEYPILGIDGSVVVTDGSTKGTGSVNCGTLTGGMFENYGTLTIEKGTFDCSIYDTIGEGGTFVLNGGKFLISNYTAGSDTYLKFLNDNKGDDVTEFAADEEGTYYVVSGTTPTTTFTVTFVNEKADPTTTTEEVKSGEYATAPDPAPSAEGFIFLGWFAADSETAFDFEKTQITEPITLTAKWAEVVAKICDTGYATIQEALNAAVDANSATTVDIVANVTEAFIEPMSIVGNGRDVTDITINVKDGVTIKNTNAEIGFMTIDNAKVTFTGSGTWYKPNADRDSRRKNLFMIGEKAVNDALAPADIVIEGGTFKADNANIFSIQNGTITVNGGEFEEAYCGTGTYCIRAEASEVKDCNEKEISGGSSQVIVNGGTFTTTYADDAKPTVPPVGVKADTAEDADVSVIIPSTSAAKFASNNATMIVGDGTMEEYLAEYNKESSKYEHTDNYKFELDQDNYYTVVAVTWATVTVTWDSNVTDFTVTATDGDNNAETIKKPTTNELTITYDVDDKVTVTIAKESITFASDYELDTDNSVLSAGPMISDTATYTLKIVSKAVTPTYDPVNAGSEKECTSETEAANLAAAINADKATMINAPDDAGDGFDRSAYGDLFVATANGSTVVVSLTDAATKTIQDQVNGYGDLVTENHLSALSSEAQTVKLDTTPGIYYTVFYGTTPTAITEHGASKMAVGDETELTFPTKGTAGFYQIKATLKAITE